MSYFIPSSIQKRLLRYALSRLELLDIDALDLEKLDIGWGRRSTVELREVGLRKAKLASVLDLPEHFYLEQASVDVLRLTVPSDLHISSIIVEIDGIQAIISIRDEPKDTGNVKKTNRESQTTPTKVAHPRTAAKSSTFHSFSQRGTSSFYSDESDDTLPTAKELATSFLTEEPSREKEELEAAWASQSVDLRQSTASSGSAEDDNNTGLGIGIGLPAFLTAFLEGISERLQVKATNVIVKLKLPPILGAEGFTGIQQPSQVLAIHVNNIEFGSANGDFATNSTSDPRSPTQLDGERIPHAAIEVNKRHVVLNDIRLALLTGPNLPTPQSEGSKRPFDDSGKQGTDQMEAEFPESSPVKSTELANHILPSDLSTRLFSRSIQSFDVDEVEAEQPVVSSTPESTVQLRVDLQDHSLSPSSGSSTPEVYLNAASNHEKLLTDLDNAIMEHSIAFKYFDTDNILTSSLEASSEGHAEDVHDVLRGLRDERPSTSLSSVGRSRTRDSKTPSPQYSPIFAPGSPSSVPALRLPERDTNPFSPDHLVQSPGHGHVHNIDSSMGESLQTAIPENSTQSTAFDIEMAKSLYMSAMDESVIGKGSPPRIPGAWDDEPETHAVKSEILKQSATSSPTVTGPIQLPNNSHIVSSVTDVRKTAIGPPSSATMPDMGTQALGGAGDHGQPMSPSDAESLTNKATPQTTALQISAKSILEIDRIDLWISTIHTATGSVNAGSVGATHDARSSQQFHAEQSTHVPGSFSYYAESKATSRDMKFSIQKNNTHNPPSVNSSPSLISKYVLILHSLHCQIDIVTSRTLADLSRIIRRCNVQTRPESFATKSGKNHVAAGKAFELNAQLRSVSMNFRELLSDDFVTVSKSGNYVFPSAASSSDPLLFTLNAKDLGIRNVNSPQFLTTVDIGHLSFGFGDEAIISFSRRARMRSSMRDTQVPDDKDVCISITNKDSVSDILLSTKPIKVLLNLQRVDNTLGSIGGLSGLLDLESSIASDLTVKATQRPIMQQHHSRTVRFEPSIVTAVEPSFASKTRFNVRVGGIALLLQGKECTVQYQASAFKLVSRDTIVGIQIDDMCLTAPFVPAASAKELLRIRLRDTGCKYLFRPEEPDLTKLISLLTPSKDKFEDDDDFLVDTLLRQRKRGAVLRVNVSKAEVEIGDPSIISMLEALGQEMSRMSTVTKYLPEESKPGLMTLGVLGSVNLKFQTNLAIGCLTTELKHAEFAHIGFPSLVACSLGHISMKRNDTQYLLTHVLPLDGPGQPPMLMARIIGDELEPTIKIKVWNVCMEYSIPLALALMELPEDATQEELNAELASSISAFTNRQTKHGTHVESSPFSSQGSTLGAKPLALDLAFRDCCIGLTPRGQPSKALLVLTDARVSGHLPTSEGLQSLIELRRGGILIIDDTENLLRDPTAMLQKRNQSQGAIGHHIPDLCQLGFVSVSSISAATISIKLSKTLADSSDVLELELKDELFLLETCADSMQTLIETLNALKPPMPPSKGTKYRTEVAPMQDMMASFTGDAFAIGAGQFAPEKDLLDEELGQDFDDLSDVAGIEPNGQPSLLHKYSGYRSDELHGLSEPRAKYQPQSSSNSSRSHAISPSPANMMVGHKWDSQNNCYVPITKQEHTSSPFQLRVRDTHIIWNLYDGYDWARTRHVITKAVQDVEAKAEERRIGRRKVLEGADENESLIGDFLFNSIYIGIPVNQDPKDLTRHINRNMEELASETASHTSTVASRPSSSHRTSKGQPNRLKLERSKRHKVAFELRGVRADVIGFAPGGETQTSVDLRINDFEIFDHIPTSTWKKFLTYMRDAGPRNSSQPMIHLEMCDVRPVPELTAAELVIRAKVLPLRLHVDQDALDFITRFFDFKDDSRIASITAVEQPYLQRVEVCDVPIKLDYKPKKIDFAGLRSGRTTEFMNFFVLEGADMVLKHTIVYGTSGFSKLHRSLEDIWMPDVKRNQLPGVLSGLNGVRTLVNVGSGVRDLIVIPVREYKKDGRVVRSISKGALAFAKITGGELTRFGAKLAVGAQIALQGAEDFFAHPLHERRPSGHDDDGWDDGDLDPEERRAISHYANQPAGILQGLKGAARSLERDLLVTKDVIIAISGEARESGTAEGAARAVVRHAPTLILRPMIGASKAIGQTLMGATNTVDPQNRRRIEEKYKRY